MDSKKEVSISILVHLVVLHSSFSSCDIISYNLLHLLFEVGSHSSCISRLFIGIIGDVNIRIDKE